MPDATASQQDVDIDLKQLLGAIWARRLRVLALTASVSALAFIGANMATSSFQGEGRLLIEPRAAAFSKTDVSGSGNDTQPLLDELNIASQVQVLSSADLIKQVARELNLTTLPEFDNSNSLSNRVLRMLHLKKQGNALSPEDRVVDRFVEKLQVYQVEKSRVIGIQFNSQDPKLAAAVPNAMMSAYSRIESDAKIDSNYEATRWLEPEIASLRQKVEEAEKKVADYRAMKDIPQSGDASSFASQQLKDMSTELARVRSDGASAAARAQAVRNALAGNGSVDTIADVANSAMMQRLRETESGLKQQIADLSTTLLNSHPRLKGLRSQLGGIQAQIRQESTKILSGIESEARVAKLREGELVRQLDAAKVDVARSSEQEVGLNALVREAAAQRQLLETYLARYREAASRSGKDSSPADARIISRAIEPREPTFPKILPITIVAGLATLMLSSITILLMELFSGRALKPATPLLRRQEDATIIAPVAVAADETAEPEALSAVVDPMPVVDEASSAPEAADEGEYTVEAVAAHIIEQRIPIVYGLSPSGDAGSVSLVMLARAVSEAGLSVILIDMTTSLMPTRIMSGDRYLPGMTDLLTGDAAFADTIHSDRESGAHLMPRGRAGLTKAMGAADRVSMITGALADAYDLVLVDCGAADMEGLVKLAGDPSVHVVLSMPQPDEETLIGLIDTCADAGVTELMLLSDPRTLAPEGWFSRVRRSVAA